ncbi:DUF885 domain-containing protein [Piscinibacter sp.]|jgi:uncharacterized protein (DUF885 family)|uniref:DUF885 domain-containing protein n=1 Tax=Piscinibacter sp. TaxID=1903157 RepID=UPI00355A4D9C
MLRCLILVSLVVFGSQACAQVKQPAPDKALQALFEREFKLSLQESPEFATFLGVEGYNDKLSDQSPAAVMRRRAHLRSVIAELQRFDARRLNAQDRLSRDLMLEDLRLTDAFNALYGPLPFSGLGGWLQVGPVDGPQDVYAALAKAAPLRNLRDYEDYLKRLAAVPLALEQATALMRTGMNSGWMPPREAMSRVSSRLEVFAGDDVAASPLFAPFKSFPVDMPADEQLRLATAGRKLLGGAVHPAFARLKRFVETEYIPACPTALAVSALPGGVAYYALAVKTGTTTTLTPQAVHAIGTREVARIQGEMDRLIAQVGFEGTRAQFIESISKDPRFYFTDPDEMLKSYRDIAKRVDAEMPKLFAELPRLPYGIRAMDAHEGDNAEHYTPGALDGSRAGYFEANVLHLATRPKYVMESTFLHEAVPGHHLQGARAQEIKGLPAFRRTAWYNAYGEGWALYAESLGSELGLYKDPYSRFGALSWEMVRACRLVIDTGLHAFGWTREQAIRYMMENAGIHEAFAASEIDRYIAQPGQALGYKIGELKIKELRARSRAELGTRFDIRSFHNALLDDGPLPLTVLETRVDEWIALQKRSHVIPERSVSR